jgi:peptidoglycan/xylan/chitin deacetylase (PgdA/CDA1 family)
MRRTGLRNLWETAQWLKYRLWPGALILMYHRVTELTNDPHWVAVTPKRFAEQMDIIRRYCIPISLQELLKALQERKVPKRAVVITFDDGYADNLYEAAPLLERYDIPATVFVTTGQIGNPRESWWDELDRLLLQPGILPPELRLTINGSVFDFQLNGSSTYTEENYRRDRDWNIARDDDPGPRQYLFRKLLEVMSAITGEERQELLDELTTWAGADPSARPTHRPLTIDELIRLGKCALMEVGAHTMTHPMLAGLSVIDQRREIKQSKQTLEAILNRSATSFAFPFGSSSRETVAIVRDEGFACACSTRADVVSIGTDYFQLPRLCVRDWDGERFIRWLRWWTDV